MEDILKQKLPGGGDFVLRYFYFSNLSKFESCKGDAFNVFVPETGTSSFILHTHIPWGGDVPFGVYDILTYFIGQPNNFNMPDICQTIICHN